MTNRFSQNIENLKFVGFEKRPRRQKAINKKSVIIIYKIYKLVQYCSVYESIDIFETWEVYLDSMESQA